MKLIDNSIEVNEEFIPNSNIIYDIYYDGELNFEAKLVDSIENRGRVGFELTPKKLVYKLDKPMTQFTDDEKQSILDYRGLNLSTDGFEASDIFMEKSYTTLIGITLSKQEIIQEMELHNADEVGIDNQWTFEEAEYHLLLSDKYYIKS